MSLIEATVDYRDVITSSNPLADIVEQKISQKGPIPFDEYMSAWLYGAKATDGEFVPGIYNGSALNIGGYDSGIPLDDIDFITAPERTPMFGYVIADQILEMWEDMGRPADFRVVEMGAGNGTLASDILNRIQEKADAEAFDAKNIAYTIVDQSPTLIAKQQAKLDRFGDRVAIIRGTADRLPLANVTGVVISNELPDAFPVKRVRNNDGKLEEAYVDTAEGKYFSEVWGEPSEAAQSHIDAYKPPITDVPYPLNVNAENWMKGVARMLKSGYVITIDYPHAGSHPALFASTAKGIDSNDELSYLDPKHMGRVDITTGIDFQMLSDVGKSVGLKTEAYVNLTGFLFGLNYDLIIKKLNSGGVKMIGDREYNVRHAEKQMEVSSQNVLIQSKNIVDGKRFQSFKYKINTDLDDAGNIMFENIKY